ncbi:MAG: xylulokinase [Mycoplasmatales bacterium]
MAYIGLDVGTSSVKGLLLNEQHEVVKTASRVYPINYFNDGWSEQNPEDWYNKSLEVLQELITKEITIKGISFSGQMHGLVILDAADQVIRPAILWNDQRTIAECQYLNEEIGKDVLRKEVGNIALTGYTLPKILWVKNHEPENFRKIKKVMLPKDYVAYKLTGVFASDVSDLSGTLLFDVKNRTYSPKMVDVSGLKIENLPKILESYEVSGFLKESLKQHLNLKNNVKVIIGGGDQAVGAVGTGTVLKDDINISLGTSGVVYVSRDKFSLPKNEIVHSFCDATGSYLLMGVALATGSSMNWFYEQILKQDNYAGLEENLLHANSSDLYFLPYISGERSPINDPLARGAFLGLSNQTTNFSMIKSIIEGTSFSLKHITESLEIINLKNIKITGGGSKNPFWRTTIASLFQTSINTINTEEGPALGAAILAMAGAQNIDIKDITKKIVKKDQICQPEYDLDEKYTKWKTIYPKIKELDL